MKWFLMSVLPCGWGGVHGGRVSNDEGQKGTPSLNPGCHFDVNGGHFGIDESLFQMSCLPSRLTLQYLGPCPELRSQNSTRI